MVLISMYKDLGTHINAVVLGDASAAVAIVARRGLDKFQASGHEIFVDPREST